jgi:hypothetical protein
MTGRIAFKFLEVWRHKHAKLFAHIYTKWERSELLEYPTGYCMDNIAYWEMSHEEKSNESYSAKML